MNLIQRTMNYIKIYFPLLIPAPQANRGHRWIKSTLTVMFTVFFALLVSSPCVVRAQDSAIVPSDLKQDGNLTISLSQLEKTWLKEHPTIVLGYADSQEPQLIVNADGSYSGIVVDLLNELNRRLGTAIQLEAYPVRELIANAKRTEIDGICNLHPEFAQRLGMLKTRGYFRHYPVIYARKDISFTDLNDLYGKTVAIIGKAYFSEKIIKEFADQVTVMKVESALEGLQSLAKGDADFFIGVSHNSYLISKYQFYDIAAKYIYTDYPDKVVMAIRSDWPILVNILNKGLSSFSETELKALVTRWINDPVSGDKITFSQKEQAWLARAHEVRVRIANYPPNYFIKDGKPYGLTVDLLKEISERSGINFHFIIPSPSFAEDLNGLKNRTGPDIIPSLQKNAERAENILFTTPYAYSPRFIFTRDDTPFISSLEELAGDTVAVEKNFLVHDWLVNNYPNINLLLVKNSKDALDAVAAGKALAYVGPLRATATMINQYGFRNLKATSQSSLPPAETSMGIRSDWPELLSIINKSFESIPESEKVAILNKWSTVKFDHGISRTDVIKWVLISIVIVIVIVSLVLLWSRSLHTLVQVRTAELHSVNKSLEQEIDERKRAEAALLEIEEEERALIDAVEGSFFLMRTDGTLLVANQGLADQFGKRLSQLIGTTAYDLLPENSLKQQRIGYIEQVIMSGQAQTFRDERDGRFFEHRLFPLKDSSGTVEKLAVFANDITKDIIAQQQIEESEKRFRATFEQAAVGMAYVSLEGRFLKINQKFCDIVGYSHDELLVLTFQDITHPDDLGLDLENIQLLLDGKAETYSMEKRYLQKDSQIIWVKLTVSLIRKPDGSPDWFVSVIENISSRKKTEEALQEREEMFSALMEQSPLSTVINNPDGTMNQVNKAFQNLWDIKEEDLPQVFENYNLLEDEQVKKLGLMPLVERAFRGEDVVLPIIEYDAASTKENLGLENVEKAKHWVQVRLYPIKSKEGKVQQVVAIEEDITSKKIAEDQVMAYQNRLRALALELTIAEENERRRLAAELHDHVGQSLVFSRIQLSDLKEQASDERFKESIAEVSQSLLGIIKDTRDLVFNLSSPLLHEVGLAAATSQWLDDDIGKKYGLETECIVNVGPIPLDSEIKALLFRNIRELLANVVKHAYANKVSVYFENHKNNLVISVEDNGIGFTVPRSPDSVAYSEGFGLFSIKERIEDVGGSLEIKSEPGKGCRAVMTIPTTS